MNIKELAKALKPLIKNCIKEVLLEESGILSHVIKESIQGMKQELLVEQKQSFKNVPIPSSIAKETLKDKKQSLEDRRKMLEESFAKSKNNNLKGVFDNIIGPPIEEVKGNDIYSPLAGMDPNDPGIDLSIFGFGK